MNTEKKPGYLKHSSSPYFGAVIALVMLFLYETLILLQPIEQAQIRNAPEAWFRSFLYFLGLPYEKATLAILGILILMILYFSRHGIQLYPRYFLWVLFESAVWGIVTAFLLQLVMRSLLLAAGGITGNILRDLGLAIGAGLFEEFFFRVLLTGGLIWLFKSMRFNNHVAIISSVLIASLLFSLSHYIGSIGDIFEVYSFMFRFFAGIWFTVLYVARGFAVACLSHAFYDFYVILF